MVVGVGVGGGWCMVMSCMLNVHLLSRAAGLLPVRSAKVPR